MRGIGFGGQGTRDMRNFMTCADVQFVAVCDVDTERRNKAKAIVDENYGNKDCATYKDFRKLLEHDDIDAMPANRKFEKQTWMDAANRQGHHRNFLDCVKTRAKTIASAEVAHRSTTTCHVANICLRLGRSVKWNPKTERFINDQETNNMISRPMRRPWHL